MRGQRSSAERINARLVDVVFVLCLVAGHAGGLGIAPLAALCGLFSLLILRPRFEFKAVPQWALAMLLFLSWAALSTLWSPYKPKGFPNALKIFLGIWLYVACIQGFMAASESPQIGARRFFWGLCCLALTFIFVDVVTNYGLTFLLDRPTEGEDVIAKAGDAEMNLGHGVTFINLLLAPVLAVVLWTENKGQWIATAFFALLVLTAFLGGVSVGSIAALGTVAMMGVAAKFPIYSIKALTVLAMGIILFAPLISAVAAWLPSELLRLMPFSWEHRIVTWTHVGIQLREAPLFGHGFDAVRTFDETFSSRGFDGLAKVPLHPHNAGLHIWAETGVVGAILSSVTVYLLGQEAYFYAHGGRARAMAVSGLMFSIILISSVSYGVWQEWWWASISVAIGTLAWVPKTRP